MEIYKKFNMLQIIPIIKKLRYAKLLINNAKCNMSNIKDILNTKYIKQDHIFTKELLFDSLHDGFNYKYKLKTYEMFNSIIYKIDKITEYNIYDLDKYIENIDIVIDCIIQHVSYSNLFDVEYLDT
jgi:hypothetical protein